MIVDVSSVGHIGRLNLRSVFFLSLVFRISYLVLGFVYPNV